MLASVSAHLEKNKKIKITKGTVSGSNPTVADDTTTVTANPATAATPEIPANSPKSTPPSETSSNSNVLLEKAQSNSSDSFFNVGINDSEPCDFDLNITELSSL